MAKVVEVPGLGNVEFPDEMADEDIGKALASHAAPRVGMGDVRAAEGVAAAGQTYRDDQGATRPVPPRPEAQPPGAVESAAVHGGNALVLNQGPRIRGLYEAGGGLDNSDDPAIGPNAVLSMLRGATRLLSGDPMAESRYGTAERDMRSDLKQGMLHHPVASVGGEVLGGAVPASLIAGAVPAVAGGGRAARMLTGARQGAAVGAAYGLGEEQPGEGAARGAVGGAVTGGALPLALEAAGKVAAPAAHYLGDKATEWGRKVLTGGAQPIGPTKKALSPEAIAEAYRQGAIRPLGTTQGASERLAAARETVGDRYGEILGTLEAQGVHGPEAESLANEIAAKASQSQQETLGSPVPEFLQARADELRTKALPISGKGRLGLMQAELMKRGLQRDAQANFSSATPQPQIGEARMDIASDMRRAIEGAVDDQAGQATGVPTAAAAEFQPVKEQLANIIEADTAARKAAARMSQHKHHSLSDTVMKAAVVSHGGPLAIPEAIATGEASRFGRLRGASTLGWLANEGSQLAGAFPQAAPAAAPALTVTPSERIASALAAAMRRRAAQGFALGGPIPAAADQESP